MKEQRILAEMAEDQDKPYAQRREMTKEDWESWHDEEPLEAQRWVTKNEQRRIDLQREAETRAKMSVKAEEFLGEQSKSVERLTNKFPNIRPKDKVLELKAKGLTKDEIHTVLENEYPEYALCTKIVEENPDWINSIDFGDKVAVELEKRMADNKVTKPNPRLYTEEEVAKIKENALKTEADRRASVDESNSSTVGGHVITKVAANKTEELQQLEALFKKAGLDPAKAKDNLARRKSLGLNNYDPNVKDED